MDFKDFIASRSSGGQLPGTGTVLALDAGGTTKAFVQTNTAWLNVQAYGFLPTNAAGANDTAIAAMISTLAATSYKGGTIYFPPGAYSVSAAIDISSLKWVNLIGDGWQSGSPYGSVLSANMSHPIISADWGSGSGTIFISGLNVRNASSNAAASAIYLHNGNSCTIEKCEVSCPNYGIYDNGSFSTAIRGCEFNGSGYLGIGLMAASGGGMVVDCCDANGWLEAIRAYGSGICITGGRYEANKTAFRLGADEAGSNHSLDRSVIQGCSLEANDYGINCQVLTDSTISGLTIPSTANAPSGSGIIGLNVTGASYCTFSAIGVNGTYSTHGIVVSGNGSLKFTACNSTEWSIAGGLTSVVFEVCNN